MRIYIYRLALFLLGLVSEPRAEVARINKPSLRLFLDLSNDTVLVTTFEFNNDALAVAAYEKFTNIKVSNRIGVDSPSWRVEIDKENNLTYTEK